MTELFMTCRTCEGLGLENNPPTFYNPGETPEVSKTCEFCEGRGEIPVNNPISVRAAYLTAKIITTKHPEQNLDMVYQQIETSVANAINEHAHKIRLTIADGDLLFSDDDFPEDKAILDFIENHGILDMAKGILNIT